jgi:3-oxoacyl-[acyl-carrier protein] reductase
VTTFDGLADKCVLITGAGGGLGSAIAETFARAGSVVGLHAHTSEAACRALAERFRAAGGKAEVLVGDLRDPAVRAGLVDRFVAAAGGIDVLVNNAGGAPGARHFLELDESAWEETFALNALAPFALARAAFRWMQAHSGGRIINISSIGLKFGGGSHTMHYSAAKAALEALSLGLAKAGAPHDILVNVIRPGVIDTPFHAKVSKADWEARLRQIPLGRAGTAQDVARMAAYLASDAGRYITGQVFAVSGGE